jgi:hypothetical protein
MVDEPVPGTGNAPEPEPEGSRVRRAAIVRINARFSVRVLAFLAVIVASLRLT